MKNFWYVLLVGFLLGLVGFVLYRSLFNIISALIEIVIRVVSE